MKKVLLLCLLMLCASPIFAQQQTAGNITTAGSDCSVATACVTLQLAANAASVTIFIPSSPSFSGTVQFEGAGGGQNAAFGSVLATPFGSTSASAVTNATAAGSWTIDVASMTSIRVRASALASGTVSVSIQSSIAIAAATLGGGGGGVSSLNSLTGIVAITSPDSSITVNTSGQDVTLSAGPHITCDASTVPVYASARCSITLSTANLLSMNAIPILAISPPGSGKAIRPTPEGGWGEYIAGAQPFASDGQYIEIGYSSDNNDSLEYLSSASVFTSSVSTFMNGAGGSIQGPVTDAANQPMYLHLETDISGGPITSSTFNLGSTGGYAASDTGSLSTCEATFQVTSVTDLPSANITAVDQGAQSFTLAGDQTSHFAAGSSFTVSGSTGNDGTYAISSVTFTTDTVIFVNSTPPSPIADGQIASALGPITAASLTSPGTSCQLGTNIATISSGFGTGLTADITGVTNGNGSAVITIFYTVVPIT